MYYEDHLAERYAEHPAVAHAEILELAGGEEAVIERAETLVRQG